jgi:putative transposase
MLAPFRCCNSSPHVIHLTVMLYIRSRCGRVEDLLFERGIDICHETVRLVRTHVRGRYQETAGGVTACGSAVALAP